MPYLFAGLLVLNALVFGFYGFIHKDATSNTYKQAVAQIKTPIAFTNVSNEIPPIIGEKD